MSAPILKTWDELLRHLRQVLGGLPDRLSRRLPGHLFVTLQEDEILAKFLRANLFGSLAEVVRELADTIPISLAGAITDRDQQEVLGEGF
ncbi:MAG: hypothetical protein M1608_03560 [Candidatus Omnitrophica bacterium]|nr:hypothetical protein [Candidatus Omnitrophota bacterium]